MTAQHLAMNRAFDAMKRFAAGDEERLYRLSINDAEAVDFIRRLHPESPIDWARDPWPGEVVPPDRVLLDGKVHCCSTVGEIQHWIRVALARDAARAAVAELSSTKVPCEPLAATTVARISNAASSLGDSGRESKNQC
jgi:hypothetical protein